MELESIVPWGRSFSEYQAMFALNASDLQKSILGCGDGPACFNAELIKIGGNIVSIDPVYQFNSEQIGSRITQVYPEVMSQVSLQTVSYQFQKGATEMLVVKRL